MQLAILGGGATGIMAACAAAEELRACKVSPGSVDVVIYEADERVGRSILATGNGRCNFSNANIDAAVYRNAAFVGDAMSALQSQHCESRGKTTAQTLREDPVQEWFARAGLMWREEGEGRLYPLANKATSVLDVLRGKLAVYGVREVCGRVAVCVDGPDAGRFHVRFSDGSVEHADAVIIAVGGRAQQFALPDAVPCAPAYPVLGPVRTDTAITKQLNNIRVRCAVSLWRPHAHNPHAALKQPACVDLADAARAAAQAHERTSGCACDAEVFEDKDGVLLACEVGEVLFRDYGVSGIAVFNLSRFVQPGDVLQIDLLPAVRTCDMEGFLLGRRKRMAAHRSVFTCEEMLCGMLLPQVARVVLQRAGLHERDSFTKAEVPALARVLKALTLTVQGIGDARQCQVMRGGIEVDAVCPRTMEVRAIPRLFAVGEALDVDAPCGGYNLHWAWASGLLAGRAAVRSLCAGTTDDHAATLEPQPHRER